MKIINELIIIILLVSFNVGMVACVEDKQEVVSSDVTINYTSSTSVITNPERGYYHQVTAFSEEGGVSLAYLKNLKNQNISLVLRLYYLDKFKNSALSQKQLDLIKADFVKMREAGVKCVLRFAYSNTLEGENAGDAPIDIVEMHIDQLKPILQENSDVIAFVQAGFIGAWGEWHSSTNNLTSIANKKRIVSKLLDALPLNVMLQLRTPLAKQDVFETSDPVDASIAFTDLDRARVGHHNDCFMASTTDYGTYTNVEVEKEFIHDETLFVPIGGETCPPSGIPMADCPKARNEMEYLRWTYLNVDYYRPVINNWNAQGCYDEFKKRLGYRIELVEGIFPKEIKTGESLLLSLKLSNKGFAPIYRNKVTSLILKNRMSGALTEFNLNIDIRECRPAGFFEINKQINLNGLAVGNYGLYLKISDDSETLKNRPEYCIQLANKDIWDSETGLNSLQHDVVITN